MRNIDCNARQTGFLSCHHAIFGFRPFRFDAFCHARSLGSPIHGVGSAGVDVTSARFPFFTEDSYSWQRLITAA